MNRKKDLTALFWLLDHLRLGADLLNIMFAIDDHADVEAAPVVREMVDTILDVLDNPYKPIPAGEIILCHAFQDFVIQLLEQFSLRSRRTPWAVSGYGH